MVNPSSDPPAYSEHAPPGHSRRGNSEPATDPLTSGRRRNNNDFVDDDEDDITERSEPSTPQARGRRTHHSDDEERINQPRPRRASGRTRGSGDYDEPPTRQGAPRLNFGNQRPSRRPSRQQDDFEAEAPSRHALLELDHFAIVYSSWRNYRARQLSDFYYSHCVPRQQQVFPPRFRDLYDYHIRSGVGLIVLDQWVRSGAMVQLSCGAIHVECRLLPYILI